MEVIRMIEDKDRRRLPYVYENDRITINVDKKLTKKEADLLISVMYWCRKNKGEINEKRFDDYVNNVNCPKFLDKNKPGDGDGEGELVFTGNVEDDGGWTLDWWECLFDNYE